MKSAVYTAERQVVYIFIAKQDKFEKFDTIVFQEMINKNTLGENGIIYDFGNGIVIRDIA